MSNEHNICEASTTMQSNARAKRKGLEASTDERDIEVGLEVQVRVVRDELGHEEGGPGRQGRCKLEVRVVDERVAAPAEVHRQRHRRRRPVLQHERRQVRRILEWR